jgi:hypothetical protein
VTARRPLVPIVKRRQIRTVFGMPPAARPIAKILAVIAAAADKPAVDPRAPPSCEDWLAGPRRGPRSSATEPATPIEDEEAPIVTERRLATLRAVLGFQRLVPAPQSSARGSQRLSRPRVPELQRLHRRHNPWTNVVAAPARVRRLLWSGCGASRRKGPTVVPTLGVARGAVDRDLREHRDRTAALDAVLPAFSHLGDPPYLTPVRGTAPGGYQTLVQWPFWIGVGSVIFGVVMLLLGGAKW